MMPRMILSSGPLFVVSGVDGDMHGSFGGLYAFDTRFLAGLGLDIHPEPRQVFVRKVSHNKAVTWYVGDVLVIREREVGDGYIERLRVINTTDDASHVTISFSYDVPMDDVFEVRGFSDRLRRTVHVEDEGGCTTYRYVGRDDVVRELRVVPGSKEVSLDLEPRAERYFELRFVPSADVPMAPSSYRFEPPLAFASGSQGASSIERLALEDLSSLSVMTPYGPTLFAGLPEFGAVFGRDAIIASLFLLDEAPEFAVGTLKLLSKLQGKRFKEKSEEEPGKIPHEYRVGELSLSGAVPFSPYYGSVDSTPLFLILAAEYLKRTGDSETIRDLGNNLELAVGWILMKLEEGDGYVRYSPGLLRNQGWKDSARSVVDGNGDPLDPPIALVEVQGYAYMALLMAADLMGIKGGRLRREARSLRRRFNRDFWLDGYYAMALDGEDSPSEVVASNMGHLLMTGVADHEREVAERLMKPDMFSGLGVRTLSSEEKTYNPFSYHNGSVWPHDNAVIALGLMRIGMMEEAKLISRSVLDAIEYLGFIPELYSGLEEPLPARRFNGPQAWSAASVFVFKKILRGST